MDYVKSASNLQPSNVWQKAFSLLQQKKIIIIISRSCCYSVTMSQLWQNGLFVYSNISLQHPTPNSCFILNNASGSLGELLSASGESLRGARRDGAWEADPAPLICHLIRVSMATPERIAK